MSQHSLVPWPKVTSLDVRATQSLCNLGNILPTFIKIPSRALLDALCPLLSTRLLSPFFLFLSIAEPLWPLGYCLTFPMHPFVEPLYIHLPNENVIPPGSCLTHSLISFQSLFKCHLIRGGAVSVHPATALYSFTMYSNFAITLII